MTDAECRAAVLHVVARAEEVLARTFDQSQAEPVFEELVEFAAHNPQLRSTIAATLAEALSGPTTPPELVEYFAHAMRWPELIASIEQLAAATADRRTQAALERLLGAFKDDWDQADIYRRFAKTVGKAD